MKTIGVRDLKARLSQILREVQDGETVLVTDRGRVVAELRKPDGGTFADSKVDRELARLAASGEMRLAERPKFRYPVSPISLPDGTAQELLDATREDRV
jgi:antitoxin (DNA-binding transcriptional repressor) of toxin-antitoxin stability system